MSANPTTGRTTPSGTALPAPGTYTFDPAHTTIEAVARHMVVTKVRGGFTEFRGSIVVGERPEGSRVEVEIDASSIDTRESKRDGHLRSPDFLDVEAHPTLTFRSTGVEHVADDRWLLHGELTIRAVTRPVALDVTYHGVDTDPWGREVAFFRATTELDREEFGITWNQALETGGVLVSRKLQVEIEVQAHHQ